MKNAFLEGHCMKERNTAVTIVCVGLLLAGQQFPSPSSEEACWKACHKWKIIFFLLLLSSLWPGSPHLERHL